MIEGTVSEQAIIDLLKALPVPITITQETDPLRGKPYYTYQVGEKTTGHPVGYGMGAARHFLDAVEMSLEVALTQGQSLIPPKQEYNL